MTTVSATNTASTKTGRGSNLSQAEKAAYAEKKRIDGRAVARARYAAAAKAEIRAKAIRAFYGEKAKQAAIAKWKIAKITGNVAAKRAGAGTVAQQVGA